MELRDYVAILRGRWLLIATTTLTVVALAALLTWRMTPQYASSTGLFISTSQVSDDQQALQGSQFSLQRVKSYAEMVKQSEITERVIQRLDLDLTPDQLGKKLSASAQLDTVILTITVRDPSPEKAQEIAAAVADVFVGYVGELETPPGTDQALIKASVVDRADLPSSPVSPNPVRNLGVGFLLGLLLGAAIAILRESLDSSVKNDRELEEITESPVIGSIPFDDEAAQNTPLITDVDSYAPRAEAFRVLRTNLQFIDPDESKKVFVLSSALPGEGKSTTACNLALALAEGGQRVCLVEGDLRRPRVAQYLGLVEAVGLTTVLLGRVQLADAVQETQYPNLHVLSSGKTPPNPAELLQSQTMASVISALRSDYDIVIIDAPPLLPVTDAALIASLVDGAVLVVRHGRTTADQVKGAVDRLEGVGAKPVAAVFNMTPVRAGRYGAYGYGYGYGYGYAPQRDEDLVEDPKAPAVSAVASPARTAQAPATEGKLSRKERRARRKAEKRGSEMPRLYADITGPAARPDDELGAHSSPEPDLVPERPATRRDVDDAVDEDATALDDAADDTTSAPDDRRSAPRRGGPARPPRSAAAAAARQQRTDGPDGPAIDDPAVDDPAVEGTDRDAAADSSDSADSSDEAALEAALGHHRSSRRRRLDASRGLQLELEETPDPPRRRPRGRS